MIISADIMKLVIILPFILSLVFAGAFSSHATVGAREEEDIIVGHHCHLQETDYNGSQ